MEEVQANKTLAMSFMFPKETKQEEFLKEQYAYYNNMTYQEIQRLLNDRV